MRVKPDVKLIDFTENPEKNVAIAARLCYSKKSPAQLQEEMSADDINRLVRKVIDMGHTSTLEHTYFYFHIQCSRVTSHQLVRQRIGVSYSQRSQRYVKEDDFKYILPPSIKKNEKAKQLFEKKMDDLQEVYCQLLEMGIPEEDARFILPTIKTNLMVSYNARSLLHFFKLRCCTRAQWEIRNIAYQMLKLVKEKAPILFEKAGPTCEVEGFCPEDDFSCGKIDDLNKGDKNNDTTRRS